MPACWGWASVTSAVRIAASGLLRPGGRRVEGSAAPHEGPEAGTRRRVGRDVIDGTAPGGDLAHQPCAVPMSPAAVEAAARGVREQDPRPVGGGDAGHDEAPELHQVAARAERDRKATRAIVVE